MRTHYCGELSAKLVGQSVTLAGWAHRRRDHGGVIFIDLRDREGLAQVVCDPDREEAFKTAERVRGEFVLKITGKVRRRPEGTVNTELRSGEVEVLAHEVEILNTSLTPPFQIDDDNISETVRLENRIIDLRREPMQRNLRLRHRAAMAARRFLDQHGFIDIETPFLYKSTPEGAREFLVPSRITTGSSRCRSRRAVQADADDRRLRSLLPDRQVFPRRDLRADRQPEFTKSTLKPRFSASTRSAR